MTTEFSKALGGCFNQTDKKRRRDRIKAVAVSAPDWVSGTKHTAALNSSDPVSLFNACRHAATLARSGNGSWGNSNWAASSAEVRQKFLLMYSLDDLQKFRQLIESERPNLLLIGAMTLCMPGAIECAKVARQILGDEVLIVLGGRHACETIYLSDDRDRSVAAVRHHNASPARLMEDGLISQIFDLVISGDGEHLITSIGEALANSLEYIRSAPLEAALPPSVPGNWIVCRSDRSVVVSQGYPVKFDNMFNITELFGISASFDVFKGRMTAHVFSDTGRGCVYDCAFCSERQSVTGKLVDIKGAPARLYKQMADAVVVVTEDHPNRRTSAFVEDSVLLGGSRRNIDEFCSRLEEHPLDIVFGAQLTIDLILRQRDQIHRLARNGLSYLFIGLETFDPEEVGGMSKDLAGAKASWQQRFLEVLSILSDAGVDCGCALLFGLGESHKNRLALLDAILEQKRSTGSPVAVSANWAVQHPLRNTVMDPGYLYLDWGTPEGPFLELFHRFGEASLIYPIAGVDSPRLQEVRDIVLKLDEIQRCTRYPESHVA